MRSGLINECLCQEATLGVNYSFQKWLDRHYCTNYFTSLRSVPNSLTHTREQTPRLTEADRALIKEEIVCDCPLPLPSTPVTLFSQRRSCQTSFLPAPGVAQHEPNRQRSRKQPVAPQHICWTLAKRGDPDGGSSVPISGFFLLITCISVVTLLSFLFSSFPPFLHSSVYSSVCSFHTYLLNVFFGLGTMLRTSRILASKSLLPGGQTPSSDNHRDTYKVVTGRSAIIRDL